MASIVYDRIWEPLQFVVDPGAVIQSNTAVYGGSRAARSRQAGFLVAFYFLNLLLYTIPLTVAGRGVEETASPPRLFAALAGPFVSDPAATWAFVTGLVGNSLFLLVASVVVFLTYHVGVGLTRSSRGLLQSMHTVAYSTGVYMAVIFTITWSLEVVRAPTAREFVRTVQIQFFYLFIDLLNAPLRPFGGRPDPVSLSAVTPLGQAFLVAEVVCVAYFLYSLYMGARLNHRASRFESLIATAFVGGSPGIYVTGNIVFAVGNPVVLG